MSAAQLHLLKNLLQMNNLTFLCIMQGMRAFQQRQPLALSRVRLQPSLDVDEVGLLCISVIGRCHSIRR